MAQKNSNLNKAKKEKNDEFYTQIVDIEKEMKYYKEHFMGKTVFCNCDDPEWSNFWRFFSLNFDNYKLKRLIATHYDYENPSYMMEMYRGENGIETKKKDLQQNGDFRSPECVELLKEADIVVTNPPFSLFREYVAQLMEYDKKFLILGNMNAVKYKEVFPLIKEDKIWLGYNGVKEFKKPDGNIQKFGNVRWFTNLDIDKRHESLILYKNYDPNEYSKYDNYDAVNVNKVSDIPVDYFGVMGVPISILDKHCPEQFEIVGELNHGRDNQYDMATPIIKGKELFPRLLIRRVDKK